MTRLLLLPLLLLTACATLFVFWPLIRAPRYDKWMGEYMASSRLTWAPPGPREPIDCSTGEYLFCIDEDYLLWVGGKPFGKGPVSVENCHFSGGFHHWSVVDGEKPCMINGKHFTGDL